MTHEEEWAVKIRGGNRTVMIGDFCSKEKVSKHNLVGKRWCCLERQEKLKLKCLIMKSRREKVPDNLSHSFWINQFYPGCTESTGEQGRESGLGLISWGSSSQAGKLLIPRAWGCWFLPSLSVHTWLSLGDGTAAWVGWDRELFTPASP